MTMPVTAEARDSSFQTFTIGSNLVVNRNHRTFHKYWQSQAGIEMYVTSPFYYGNIQIGFQYIPFIGKVYPQSSFNSLYIYINWQKNWDLYHSFHFSMGGRIGFYQMHFKHPDINITLAHEQEFAAGLCTGLGYSLPANWQINITGTFLKIYTYKRIRHSIFSLGISRRFDTPQWLQNFIK